MKEYIERGKAIEIVKAHERQCDPINWIIDELQATDAADVQQEVCATWVAIGKVSPIAGYKCSRCNAPAPIGFCGKPARSNYCPDCGAKMQ